MRLFDHFLDEGKVLDDGKVLETMDCLVASILRFGLEFGFVGVKSLSVFDHFLDEGNLGKTKGLVIDQYYMYGIGSVFI